MLYWYAILLTLADGAVTELSTLRSTIKGNVGACGGSSATSPASGCYKFCAGAVRTVPGAFLSHERFASQRFKAQKQTAADKEGARLTACTAPAQYSLKLRATGGGAQLLSQAPWFPVTVDCCVCSRNSRITCKKLGGEAGSLGWHP